jgi:two-component system NtrC family sensor kinase
MEDRDKTKEQLAPELKECRRELALLKLVADAVERMQVGVTIRDTVGKIVYVNSTEAEMHGRKPEELLGKYVGILAPRELTDPLTVEKMKQMKNWSRESVNIRTDGTTFPVRLISDILTDAHGTPTGIVTICEDISERKEQEEQLIQADKMISLGTLLVGMAHEINNPNNFILLNSEFLSTVWQDLLPILDRYVEANGDFLLAGMAYSESRDKISKSITDIVDGSRRIKNLISELKNFTRPEHSLLTDDVDINEVVKSAISLVANQIRLCTRRFTVNYGKKLPLIPGNVQRLQQVVFNLLLNSCQALTDTKQRIFISTARSKDRRHVEVVVKDEGSGIPADLLKRVWDPFFTTKREQKSSGLGLFICDNVIRSHHGNIVITSKPGRGTTVTVHLPIERELIR